jgi:hypothetical protein
LIDAVRPTAELKCGATRRGFESVEQAGRLFYVNRLFARRENAAGVGCRFEALR